MSIDTKRCSLIILFLWSMTGDVTLLSARAAAPTEQALSPKQTVVKEFSRIAEQKRLLEQQQQRLRDQWQAMARAQQQAGITAGMSNEHSDPEAADFSSSASQGQSGGKISGLSLVLFVGLGLIWRRFFAAKAAGELQDEIDINVAEGIENIQGIWGIPQTGTGDPEWKPVEVAEVATVPSFRDRKGGPQVDKPTDRHTQAQTSLASDQKKRKATLKRAAPAPVRPVTPHADPAAPGVPHLLVVEDNVVNQKLLVRILEKMGYTADAAGNGKAALAAVARTSYALISMDCQMPEMHGFEATARIRQHEAQTGVHIRIVAVTAETSPGAREMCLKAGMDEYMAKPITPSILRDMLVRWAPLPADAVRDENTPRHTNKKTLPTAPLPPPCNISEALVHIDGDRELLQEMADVFLTECPYFLEQIQTAIAEDDGLVLASAARTLKVSVSNFVAAEVFEAAAALEKWARMLISLMHQPHSHV
jgi:CheY-like chemotaxis protein